VRVLPPYPGALKKPILVLILLLVVSAIWALVQWLRPQRTPTPGGYTVTDRLVQFGPAANAYWCPLFSKAGVAYPPRRLLLMALKEERRLEVYAAADTKTGMTFITSFPILAASGSAGLKLCEGDRQVPEGFYRIELLNPNSRFHLSLRVNYPNAEDIAAAQAEGRDIKNLGGDIMIHGGEVSTGCLALGDPAIERLFVLAARVPLDGIQMVILPRDLREVAEGSFTTEPERVRNLYERLREFQLSPSSW